MNKNPHSYRLPTLLSAKRGFTLIEMLVVIVIIAVLAVASFSVGPKMMRRADAAKSIGNMRQIGALLASYASENSNKLPAPRADVPNGKGGFDQLHWHETVMLQLYPDTDLNQIHNDSWWEATKPIMRNPLCTAKTKPWAFTWWNPGYAMNVQISENLGKSSGDWSAGGGGGQAYQVPLSSIPEPGRTPIVAQRGDWHYTFTPDQIKDENLTAFLVDGKMPILFVDGHVETMKLTEYTSRELYKMPKK